VVVAKYVTEALLRSELTSYVATASPFGSYKYKLTQSYEPSVHEFIPNTPDSITVISYQIASPLVTSIVVLLSYGNWDKG